MRPKWAGGPANRPDGPLQSLRRRVWAARVFALSVPDAFEKHFFNGLLNEVEECEDDLLDRAWGLEAQSRLSCQAIVATEDLTVEIPKYTINHAKENH